MTILDDFIIQMTLDTNGVSIGAKAAEKRLDNVAKKAKESGNELDKNSKKSDDHARQEQANAKKSGSALEKAGLQGKNAFDALKRSAVAAFAVLSGSAGMRAFMSDIAQSTVGMDNLAKSIGDTQEHLTGIGYALGEVGIPRQAGANLFQNLLSKSTNRDASREANMAAGQWGVTAIDTRTGQVNTHLLEDLYRSKEFMKQTAGMKGETFERLGGDPRLANFYQYPNRLQKIKEYENYAPTDTQNKKAHELLESWTHVEAQTNKVLLETFNKVEPGLNALAHGIDAIEASNPSAVAEGLIAVSGAMSALSVWKILGGGKKGLIGAAVTAAGFEGLGHWPQLKKGWEWSKNELGSLSSGLIGSAHGATIDTHKSKFERYLGAIIMAESSGDRLAGMGKSKHLGLGQLDPDIRARYKVHDPFDPVQNFNGAQGYFKHLLKLSNGDYDKAIRMYHDGPNHKGPWSKDANDEVTSVHQRMQKGQIYTYQRAIQDKAAAIHNNIHNDNRGQVTVNGSVNYNKSDERPQGNRATINAAMNNVFAHTNMVVG